MHCLSTEIMQRAGLVRIQQVMRITLLHSQPVFLLVPQPVSNHQVDFLQTTDRFPQRPGRHQEAVAESSHAINHGNLDITLQGVVLQAVITQDDITVTVCNQRCCGRYTIEQTAVTGM